MPSPHESTIKRLHELYDGDIVRLVADIRQFHEKQTVKTIKPSHDFSNAPTVISVDNLSKKYKLGGTVVNAVEGVSLDIKQGEMVALVGASGSGKSTLLQMIGGLDKPSSGTVTVDGEVLGKMRDGKLSRYRGQKIGFVFQSFYLQPFLNVQANIEIPAVFARTKRSERHKQSLSVAEAVGLQDRTKHYGKELSGGQIQRTAIARALMNRPRIILADEPTGNLDQANADAIFELFENARKTYGTTIVVVTHDEDLAERMDRKIRLMDGRVVL